MSNSCDALQMSLQFLKGVGPRRAASLQESGLSTIEDLLYRLPIRYEDRGDLQAIETLKSGKAASVVGEVLGCHLRSTRRPGFKIFEILIRDSTGVIRAIWFNQPFLQDVFQLHQRVALFGKIDRGRSGGLQLTNPQYVILDPKSSDDTSKLNASGSEAIKVRRIVPIYEKVGSLTLKMHRRLVYNGLMCLSRTVTDPIPEEILRRLKLPDRRSALISAHFPKDNISVDLLNQWRSRAQVRLVFEEFFLFQFGLALRRQKSNYYLKARQVKVNESIRKSASKILSFRLTDDQKSVLTEIVTDMQLPQPMNRLLQGDVGSGKTIVALLAGLVAMENGFQVAFMGPTEVLADQHFLYIRKFLEKSRFKTALLTGTMPTKVRRQVYADLSSGAANFVVGTNTLAQNPVAFHSLGLVIVDEQHRFGVLQRAILRSKGLNPDVLVMTATPIPRTLALTAYGDLDISTIRELPPGRQPVKTIIKPETSRSEAYDFVKRQLDEGRQAYIVCPLVEDSDKVDLKAATEMADLLANKIFKSYRVALLHGRIKPDGKDSIMREFQLGRYDLLVSTTVVEVGMDVSNASVIVIENAERFGLAQLHQLRGRVGRGRHNSYCILLYKPSLSDQARARLEAIAQTNDGFVIAEKDLELRGPGDLFGTRQSGMPTFRVGDIVRDYSVMEEARGEALSWIDQEPALVSQLIAFVEATWEGRFGLVDVG